MAARLFSVVLCPLFASRTSRISLFCFLLHWITRAPPRFPLRTPLLCFTLTSSLWSLSRGSRVTHDWLLSWWLTDYWSLSIVTSWFKRSASDSGSRSAVQPRSASGSQPPSHPEEGFSVSCWPPGLCGSESKCQHWMWPGAIELFGINCLSWDRIDGITNHLLPHLVYVKCVKYQLLTSFSCVQFVTLISSDPLTTTSITKSRCYFQVSCSGLSRPSFPVYLNCQLFYRWEKKMKMYLLNGLLAVWDNVSITQCAH